MGRSWATWAKGWSLGLRVVLALSLGFFFFWGGGSRGLYGFEFNVLGHKRFSARGVAQLCVWGFRACSGFRGL